MKDILSSKPVTHPDPALYESTSPRSPKDALKYLLPQVRPYGRVKSPYTSNPRTPKQKKFAAAKLRGQSRHGGGGGGGGGRFGGTKTLKNHSKGVSGNLKAKASNSGDGTVFNFSNIPTGTDLESTTTIPAAARNVQFSASKGAQIFL